MSVGGRPPANAWHSWIWTFWVDGKRALAGTLTSMTWPLANGVPAVKGVWAKAGPGTCSPATKASPGAYDGAARDDRDNGRHEEEHPPRSPGLPAVQPFHSH